MIMKELSIEEKAKRYDEALKVLHKYDGVNIIFSQSLKEKMFPELKESEDEKIKKSLIRLVKAFYDCNFPTPEGFERKDILAWIEKQSEQKSAWSEESSAFKDKLLELFQKFRYIKESAPTNGDIIDYVDAHIQELIDTMQKPTEWDGEEEKMLNEMYEFFDTHKIPSLKHNMDDYAKFIKSLKDKVQPKQEWSEEDESHIRYLIECLEHCKKGVSLTMTTPTAQEYIDWLKSLRPRSTWKPSKEQMKELNIAKNSFFELSYRTKGVLKSLYQDLEKLKG